jgi:hypothetical protein
MGTTQPTGIAPGLAVNDFRRLVGIPAVSALADSNPDLYLALRAIVNGLGEAQVQQNSRIVKLENAPGVVIPPPPQQLVQAIGYTTLAAGQVTVSEPTCQLGSIIMVTSRAVVGTVGVRLAVPAGSMRPGQFTILSYKGDGTQETADNSEVGWMLANPVTP